jgi:hypothetical protein
MKKSLRLSSIAVACAAGLALAATALPAASSRPLTVRALGSAHSFQAYAPSVTVQQSSYKVGAATNVGFLIYADPTQDATAKITIFSPSGYTNVLTQTPGAVIGKAYALVRAGALGNSDLTLTGNVLVGNPADPTLMAASQQCTGSPTNQAIWVLNTQLQGQALQVPAFVNQVGPYLVQQICLLPPASAPFQAQLWLADYTVNGVFRNAPASNAYSWAGDFTPYAGSPPAPNAAGTVEYRTYVGLPSSLTFTKAKIKAKTAKAKAKAAKEAAFAGKLAVAGLTVKGIKLDLYSNVKSKPAPNLLTPSLVGVSGRGKPVRTKALTSKGTYTLLRTRPKKKSFFQMFFGGYELTSGCQGPSPSGQSIPCTHEEIAPLDSAQIAVSPPPKKKHK